MITVKVLEEHGNGYGESWLKKKGKTYDLPEAEAKALAGHGLVELQKKGHSDLSVENTKPCATLISD